MLISEGRLELDIEIAMASFLDLFLLFIRDGGDHKS